MPVELFLSTPSARRATGDVVSAQHIVDISIHALREEGDVGHGIVVHRSGISIHALREEGDEPIDHCTHAAGISIHALREEGDICSLGYDQLAQIFLSTPSARRATARQRRDCLRQ